MGEVDKFPRIMAQKAILTVVWMLIFVALTIGLLVAYLFFYTKIPLGAFGKVSTWNYFVVYWLPSLLAAILGWSGVLPGTKRRPPEL
jgi:hypothetical protein